MRHSHVISGLIAFLAIASPGCGRQEAPPRIKTPVEITRGSFGTYMGGGLGLNTPLELWHREIEHAKRIGIGIARFNADCWNIIEPRKGEYRWEPLDKIIDLLHKSGIEILFTFPISSSWNADARVEKIRGRRVPVSHFPAKDVRDIEELSFRVASRYRDKITYYEAWNEPDYPFFWRGDPSPSEYLEVLKRMHRGAKRGDPHSKIVVGGLAKPLKVRYFRKLLELGAADFFDIMNIHVYVRDLKKVRRSATGIMRLLERSGAKKPLWVTEISTTGGYYPTRDHDWEEKYKAAFLVQSYAILFTEGVERIFWHNLRKCGRELGYPKDLDFGLLDADFGIQPAYQAHGELASRLMGSYEAESVFAGEGLRAYKFKKKASAVYIAWSEKGERPLELPVPSERAVCGDVLGNAIAPDGGDTIRCRVGRSPVYVEESR
ncbi:MAG: beta-galactosidase [Elusimicrobiota bacterium]